MQFFFGRTRALCVCLVIMGLCGLGNAFAEAKDEFETAKDKLDKTASACFSPASASACAGFASLPLYASDPLPLHYSPSKQKARLGRPHLRCERRIHKRSIFL